MYRQPSFGPRLAAAQGASQVLGRGQPGVLQLGLSAVAVVEPRLQLLQLDVVAAPAAAICSCSRPISVSSRPAGLRSG